MFLDITTRTDLIVDNFLIILLDVIDTNILSTIV
jgi:hypothetical protein